MFVFCKTLYENPETAHQKAQQFHQQNNHRPILHLVSHGALCAVFLRKKQMFRASKQVYLLLCAPFATILRRDDQV